MLSAVKKYVIILLVVFSFFNVSYALTSSQVNAILALLRAFGAPEEVVSKVANILNASNSASSTSSSQDNSNSTTSAASTNQSANSTTSSNTTFKAQINCDYLLNSKLIPYSKNEAVKEAQKALKLLGFFNYPEITNYYGPATIKAVKAFQCKYLSLCSGNMDLNGYGLLGPKTKAKLCSLVKHPIKDGTNEEHRKFDSNNFDNSSGSATNNNSANTNNSSLNTSTGIVVGGGGYSFSASSSSSAGTSQNENSTTDSNSSDNSSSQGADNEGDSTSSSTDETAASGAMSNNENNNTASSTDDSNVTNDNSNNNSGDSNNTSSNTATSTQESSKTCTLDGVTLNDGARYTFYELRYAPYGETCESFAQRRQCTNGTLSGSDDYVYASCESKASQSRLTQLSIDRSNTVWLDTNKRQLVINTLAKIPAEWFRDGIRGARSASDFAEILKSIQNQGKKILVIVHPWDYDYDDPKNARVQGGEEFKNKCGWSSGALPLSKIDLDKFKARLETYLKEFKNKGVEVNAFEIGNELDWVCFNGDIPLNSYDERYDFHARNYAKFLKAAVSVINKYYPQAKIVSFGAANIKRSQNVTGRLKQPGKLLAALRNVDGKNYLKYLDGIGIHFYRGDLSENNVKTIVEWGIKTLFSEAGISNKPIWITEWGIRSIHVPEPERRLVLILDTFNKFKSLNNPFVSKAFYYALDSFGTYLSMVDKNYNFLLDTKAYEILKNHKQYNIYNFSTTQGANNWYYLGYNRDSNEYYQLKLQPEGFFKHEIYKYPKITKDYMMPYLKRPVVLAWKSDFSGNISIIGRPYIYTGQCGDGVEALIYKNNERLWSQDIKNGETSSYIAQLYKNSLSGSSVFVNKSHNIQTKVNPGDYIYFVVDSGPDNPWCDGVVWKPMIVKE